MQKLIIREEEGDVFEIRLTPDKTPMAFWGKVEDLMTGGLSRQEAEDIVTETDIVMEVFCDTERGLFAVESEPLGYIPVYNPYTGEEIPNENLDDTPTESVPINDVTLTTGKITEILMYYYKQESLSSVQQTVIQRSIEHLDVILRTLEEAQTNER